MTNTHLGCCPVYRGRIIRLTLRNLSSNQLFYIVDFFYAACTVPIKSSICICLIRIAEARRRFIWSLCGLIALQSGAAVIFIIAIGNICHPATALWGETSGVCNPSLNSHASFFFSVVSIVTDLSLAVLPAILLWPIQMKRRLKFSVVVILGLAALYVNPWNLDLCWLLRARYADLPSQCKLRHDHPASLLDPIQQTGRVHVQHRIDRALVHHRRGYWHHRRLTSRAATVAKSVGLWRSTQ